MDSSSVERTELDPELGREIRASFLLAGPLLARFGRATVPPPGGDVIGRRRLDTHFHAFAELGVEVELNGGYDLRTNGLRGKRMFLDEASVMATENAAMAAVLAEGETIVGHAACEPHIQDLCRFLVTLGAQIDGIGSNVLKIVGVPSLGGGAYRIRSEHVEVASFAALAAVTGGEITVEDVEPDDLISIVPAFRKLGIHPRCGTTPCACRPTRSSAWSTTSGTRSPRSRAGSGRRSRPTSPRSPSSPRRRRTATVLVFEKMFESRLFFVDKLVSMGARIVLCDPHRVVVTGPAQLYGQRLESPDIRAGMAMVIAALRGPGPLDDRQRRPDRPRLRGDRRPVACPRRPDRACRPVSGARIAEGPRRDQRRHRCPGPRPPAHRARTGGRLRAHARDRAGRPRGRGGRGRHGAASAAPSARCCPKAPSARRRPQQMRRSRWWSSSAPTGRSSLRTPISTGAGGLGTDPAARTFLGRLSEEAGLTVHVRLMEGEDTGHALAAIFKALGVALARATAA